MTDDEKQTSLVTNRSESFVIFLVLRTKSNNNFFEELTSGNNSPASDCAKTSICFKCSQNINLQLQCTVDGDRSSLHDVLPNNNLLTFWEMYFACDVKVLVKHRA